MTATRYFSSPVRVAVLLCAALFAIPVAAQAPAELGRPIVDLIAELRAADIRIVYSEELLPARLRVTLAPAGGTPFERLDAILAPHGLGLELGPRETWLVVRRPAPAPAAPDGAGSTAGRTLPRPPFETIVVTASRYSIERPSATSATAIPRHTLENTTALGQDPLRVTHNLPGVTSDQLTSQAHIRGGTLDEVLLRLDGVRLYNPYHLKDFQTVFSSINPRVIESMDVRTGGFESSLGDRMSGVIDMQSVTPTELRHHELSLSLLETAVLSSGVFANGRGSWLTSVRRGNLDVLAEQVDSDIGQPQYVDFFNKLEYALSPRSKLTAGILTLDDKLTLNDGDVATAGANYDDVYYWLTLARSAESGLESRFQLASTSLARNRDGRVADPNRVVGTLSDASAFDSLTLSGDFEYDLSDRFRIIWGLTLESLDLSSKVEAERTDLVVIRADDLTAPNAPPSFARVDYGQTKRAFYMSYRLRPLERLILELGARWDEQSLTGESQTSPRLNLLFDLGSRTSLRAAWGQFDQSHSLDELAIADGSESVLPAAESEHMVVGVEHLFGDSGILRIEVYSKDVNRLNHRFENIYERVSLIPELLPDRFEIDPLDARIRGVELSVEGEALAFSWWANLARARTEERLASGRFARSWDERWSAKFGAEWQGPAWTATAGMTFRSGWPITGLALVNDELVAGSFNALRLPDFSSFDVRAERSVATTHGELDWFLEITNLFDRSNYCCLDYTLVPASGTAPASLELELDELLGIVPNIGLRWQF